MRNLVGIIPAAGYAARLSPLPFSKELYPIGVYKFNENDNTLHPKPVILNIFEQMRNAGVKKVFVIINEQKWDIGQYIKNGNDFGLEVAYLVQEKMNGMPYALNLVKSWFNDNETALFGMPDTIFYPTNALYILSQKHYNFKADLTLGLFPTLKPYKYGMVEFDSKFNFITTIDKPETSILNFMWGCACWERTFSEYLNTHLKMKTDLKRELILGDVFIKAKEDGMKIKVVPFKNGDYYDIGTLDEILDLQRSITLKNY